MEKYTLKNGKTLEIDYPKPSDAFEIIEYLNRVGGESDNLTFGKNDFFLTVEEEKKFIESLPSSQAGFLLNGVVEGKIISTLGLLRSNRPRLNHIGELGVSVSADYWGLGVGRKMCERMLVLGKEQGITKINLKVRDDNKHAIHLYKNLGFTHEGVLTRAFKINGQYFSELIMGLSL